MTFLFSGRRRLRGNSQDLCDDNTVSDTWAMTRDSGEERAVTDCDPTRDTLGLAPPSSSPPRQPSPLFLSSRGPGPRPHHSQSLRLCLLPLVLVTLISCAGQFLPHVRMSTTYIFYLVGEILTQNPIFGV